MSQPTKLPEWATDTSYPVSADSFSGTDTKTEPSSGKKAEGWEPGEPPPAQYMNYWQNLVALWIEWLGFGAITENCRLSVGDGNWSYAFDAGLEGAGIKTTGSGVANIEFGIQVGRRITSVTFQVAQLSGGHSLTSTVYEGFKDNTASSSLGTNTTTPPNGSWSTVTIDVTDTVADATNYFYLNLSANGADVHIKRLQVTHDAVEP